MIKRYTITYPEEVIEDPNGEWCKFEEIQCARDRLLNGIREYDELMTKRRKELDIYNKEHPKK